MKARTLKIRRETFGAVVFDPADRRYLKLDSPVTEFDSSRLAAAMGLAPEDVDGAVEVGDGAWAEPTSAALASPLAAYIEISEACSQACAHCFKPDRLDTRRLDPARWRAILDDLAAAGVFELRFAGFEPTAAPHFPALAAYAKAAGFYLVLNTNGFFGARTRRTVLDLGFDDVLVSLEGREPVHDRIRGRGSHRAALALLEDLSAAGGRARINMTVSRANLDEMGPMAALASRLGLTAGFAPMRRLGTGGRMDPAARLDASDMRRIAATVRDLRRAHPSTPMLLAYHDHMDGDALTYHPLWLCDPCPAAKNVSILSNGQVYLCDFLAHLGDHYCGGSVFEQPVLDIWRRSPEFARYRSIAKAGTCLACPRHGARCSGGCSAESLGHGGVFFDPLCFVRGDSADADRPAPDKADDLYDEDYFRRGEETGKSNYRDYRWLPEKTLPEAEALISLWDAKPGQTVIDFGAAFGFYVKAFRRLGLEAYGVDVSPYAVAEAGKDSEAAPFVRRASTLAGAGLAAADWVLAKDVLEHLTLEELSGFLSDVRRLGAGLAVVVPLARYDGGRYLIPSAEKDAGHNLRRSRAWWLALLRKQFPRVAEQAWPGADGAEDGNRGIGFFVAWPDREEERDADSPAVKPTRWAGVPAVGAVEP